jgi:hypothetical protein
MDKKRLICASECFFETMEVPDLDLGLNLKLKRDQDMKKIISDPQDW